MKSIKYLAAIAIVLLLGSVLNLTLPIEPAYAANNNGNGNGNSNNHGTHFTFGIITASPSTIQLEGSTTIFVPVTNTHPTLASSVNPGNGNTFINLFASGNNISNQFTITRTDSVTVIQAGATATLTYTVTTTSYTGSVDVQAFASGRLPPPEQGAVQIQLHTVTSSTASNAFSVTAQSMTVNTNTGIATFATNSGSLSNLQKVDESTLPSENRPTISFPYGIFAFTINNLNPGATVTITITFPSDVPIGSQYWKVIGNSWVRLPDELVGDNDGDNILTLTLTDGGTGDADGLANSTIVDPGGPAGSGSTVSSVVGSNGSGSSCDGRIVITNDPTVYPRCVIVDTQAPKILRAFVTPSGYHCVETHDNLGTARVTYNGKDIPRWSGAGNGYFCTDEELPLVINIVAEDLAENKNEMVSINRQRILETVNVQTFTAVVAEELNPHHGVEGIILKSDHTIEQIRIAKSPDFGNRELWISEKGVKKLDGEQMIEIRYKGQYTDSLYGKEKRGHLYVFAANIGRVATFDVIVDDDIKLYPHYNKQKHKPYDMELIDMTKINGLPLNAWQKAELESVFAGSEDLSTVQMNVLSAVLKLL